MKISKLALLAPIVLATSAFSQVVIIPQQPVIVNNPIIGQVTAGTTLTVHGATSPDRRYVNMNIQIHDEKIDGFETFIFGGGNVNGINVGNGFVAQGGGGGNAVAFGAGSSLLVADKNYPNGLIPINAKFTEISPRQLNSAPVLRANDVTLLANSDVLLSRPTSAVVGEMSLQDAVRKIAGETKINIHLSANVLNKSGVDTAARQKFDVPAGNVEKSLIYILAQGVREVPIAIKAEDNLIVITTREQVDQQVVTRAYPLDRMTAYLRHLDPKDADFKKVTAGVAGEPSTDTPVTRGIAKLIRPEVWKVNGGKTGVAIQDGTKVIIQAPISVHAALPIEELPNEKPTVNTHLYGKVPAR